MCMYVHVCACIDCIKYVYASICMYMLILACIDVYVCVLTCLCMYPYVYACISFSVLHKTQKGKGGTGQDLVPSNVLSKRESKGSKLETTWTSLGLEHTSPQ